MTAPLKPVTWTQQTTVVISAGLSELEASIGVAEKAETLARIILGTFEDYYIRSRKIPWLAKQAFEARG